MNTPDWIKAGARIVHKASGARAKIVDFRNGNPVIEFDEDGSVYDDYSPTDVASKFAPLSEGA